MKHTIFFFSGGYFDESKSTKPDEVERRVCSLYFRINLIRKLLSCKLEASSNRGLRTIKRCITLLFAFLQSRLLTLNAVVYVKYENSAPRFYSEFDGHIK